MEHQDEQQGSTDTDTDPPANNSLLLSLPAELRDHIFQFAVREDNNPIRIRRKSTLQTNEIHQPGLTRTCRSVREATLPLYYTLNTFAISLSTQHLEVASKRWLHAIGPQNRAIVKRVYVSRRDWDGYFKGLETFSRDRSRFLKLLRFTERTRLADGHGYCVVQMGCLTFDD